MSEQQKQKVVNHLKQIKESIESVKDFLDRSGEKTKYLQNAKMEVLTTINKIKEEPGRQKKELLGFLKWLQCKSAMSVIQESIALNPFTMNLAQDFKIRSKKKF